MDFKKIFLALIFAIAILFIIEDFLELTTLPPKPSVEIVSYKVIVDQVGIPFLEVMADIKKSPKIFLISPSGNEIDHESVIGSGRMKISLRLGYNTPSAGLYKLITKDSQDNIISTADIGPFEGSKVIVREVNFKWKKLDAIASNPDWTIKLKNEGDLPIYLTDASIKIEKEEAAINFQPNPTVLLSGEEKVMNGIHIGGPMIYENKKGEAVISYYVSEAGQEVKRVALPIFKVDIKYLGEVN